MIIDTEEADLDVSWLPASNQTARPGLESIKITLLRTRRKPKEADVPSEIKAEKHGWFRQIIKIITGRTVQLVVIRIKKRL